MAVLPTSIYRETGFVRETERAVCVRVDRASGIHKDQGNVGVERVSEVWLPKSQIEWRADHFGEQLFAPAWLIRKAL